MNHATQSDAWLYGLTSRRQRRRWSPRFRLALMRRSKASRTGQDPDAQLPERFPVSAERTRPERRKVA
jgi:hypothetical protein